MLGDEVIKGIDAVHPSLKEKEKCLTRMRDFSLGEDAVKAKKEDYYPRYYSQSETVYKKVVDMAPFEDWVPSLVETYSSLIFSKPPQVTTPTIAGDLADEEVLDELITAGWTFNQFTMKFVAEYITMGRVGLWASVDSKGRSKLISYPSENIINWKRDSEGNLEYVVLKEEYYAPADENEFKLEEKRQYRVLYMKEGVANVAVYRKIKDETGKQVAVDFNQGDFQIVADESFPLEKKNATTKESGYMTELPFWIFTVSGNPASVENPPLLPIANLNHKHYIISGLRMMAIHSASFPLLVVSDVKDAAASDEATPDKFQAGPGTAVFVGEHGDVKYASFEAKGAVPMEMALKDSKETLGMLSRKLLDSKKGIVIESGKAHQVKRRTDFSVLEQMSDVLSRGFTNALNYIAKNQQLGWDKGEFKVKFNNDFLEYSVDPQELMAMTNSLKENTIGFESFFAWMKNRHIVDEKRTLEEEMADIKNGEITKMMREMMKKVETKEAPNVQS